MDPFKHSTPNVEEVDLEDVAQAPPVDPGVHRHGYVVRYEILLPPEDADRALRRFSDRSGKDWIRCGLRGGGTRWIIRGSTSVTQRPPRNARLLLNRLNRQHKTMLYSVIVERHGDRTFLDLHGVRCSDADGILEGVCQLAPNQYKLAYYRRLEVFVVVSPKDAYRMANALGTPSSMRGNKHRLVDNMPVPVTIKTRTQATARLTLYRIPKGITSAFKLELALVGRRDRRHEFAEEDAQRLEEVLLALVEAHGLELRSKPARWEPVTPSGHARDPRLSRLGRKAYRGRRVSPDLARLIANCHAPDLVWWVETRDDTQTSTARPCIRSNSQTSSPQTEPEPSGSAHRGANSALWRALADDLLRSRGMLSEVLLDHQRSPEPLIQTLLSRFLQGEVSVSALSFDGVVEKQGWYCLHRLIDEYPLTPTTSTIVLVIDPSLAGLVCDAITAWDKPPPSVEADRGALDAWLASSPRSIDGPFVPKDYQFPRFPLHWHALAARLDEMLHDLRHACEQEDSRVILLSVDARPHGGEELCNSDYHRDGQMRSILADGARYNCHNRYLVEPHRVVMLKDSLDGLPGRIVF